MAYTQRELDMIARDRAAEAVTAANQKLLPTKGFFQFLEVGEFSSEWQSISKNEQDSLMNAYQIKIRNESEANIADSYRGSY